MKKKFIKLLNSFLLFNKGINNGMKLRFLDTLNL